MNPVSAIIALCEEKDAAEASGKENTTMGDGKNIQDSTRRRFLQSGGALLASGVIGGIAANGMAQSQQVVSKPPPLPWPWAALDPMEAGSRAYRYYLDAGG